VNDQFSVRATVGSGFHAPTPGQSNTQVLTTNFVAGNSVQTGTFPVTSSVAKYFGSKALKPEEFPELRYRLCVPAQRRPDADR